MSVEYGDVVLDGVVTTHREKLLAERDARGVIGVQSVTNNLNVNVSLRDDASIQNDVTLDLTNDAVLHQFGLVAKTQSGVVTLSGKVDTLYHRMHAETLAKRVRGVSEVANQIVVNRDEVFDDNKLTTQIGERLRQSQATHASTLIHVKVVNGVAILTGTVDSWAEHQAAALVAFRTKGIWKVENGIVVEGYDYKWEELRQESKPIFDPTDPSIPHYLDS